MLTAFFSSTFDNVPQEEDQITAIICNFFNVFTVLYIWLLLGRTQKKHQGLFLHFELKTETFRTLPELAFASLSKSLRLWYFNGCLLAVAAVSKIQLLGLLVNSEQLTKATVPRDRACPNTTQITLYESARTPSSKNAFISIISTINWMPLSSSATWVTHIMAGQHKIYSRPRCYVLKIENPCSTYSENWIPHN